MGYSRKRKETGKVLVRMKVKDIFGKRWGRISASSHWCQSQTQEPRARSSCLLHGRNHSCRSCQEQLLHLRSQKQPQHGYRESEEGKMKQLFLTRATAVI